MKNTCHLTNTSVDFKYTCVYDDCLREQKTCFLNVPIYAIRFSESPFLKSRDTFFGTTGMEEVSPIMCLAH